MKNLIVTLLVLFVVVADAEACIQNNEGAGFRSPQDIDGSRNGAAPNAARQAVQQSDDLQGAQTSQGLASDLTKTNSQGQQIFDALVQELDSMIPGELADQPAMKKAIDDAVTAFQIKDVKRVQSIFDEQFKQGGNFPPTDVLLAALSYAVQDANSGQLLLERAAIGHPEYPGIYSAFARLAINQGRTTDALALLEKCQSKIASAKMDETGRKYFETQCRDGLVDVAMRQKRYDDARRILEQQRVALPGNAKIMMVSAELEFQQNNIEKALEYLTQLKSKFSSTRVPESILASWYQQTGKPTETEKWIKAAAQKYPDEARVQLEFASWAIEQEDFPTASSAIIKAEKVSSESLVSRNLKGKIAFCKQSYGTAESHFKAIAEAQPNNFDAVNMYALSLIESNDPEKQKLAKDIASRNFRALPENVIAQAALGYVALKLGETEQAKTILSRVARSPGNAPEIGFFLASLLEKIGEKQQAKLVVEQALKHKGVFLYRSSAKRMLQELGSAAGASSLPTPDK